jgi:hypothetical protein
VPQFLKNVSDLALILAGSAFALVCIIFAIFLKPKLDSFDKLKADYTELKSRFNTLKVDDNLRDLQNLSKDVAVLKSSEEQRDRNVRDAIDAVGKSLKELENRIHQAMKAGDRDNLRNLLEVRVDQTETAYTLSKIQGGTKEEEARDEWIRAKDQLAQFYAEEQKGRADSTAASGV